MTLVEGECAHRLLAVSYHVFECPLYIQLRQLCSYAAMKQTCSDKHVKR